MWGPGVDRCEGGEEGERGSKMSLPWIVHKGKLCARFPDGLEVWGWRGSIWVPCWSSSWSGEGQRVEAQELEGKGIKHGKGSRWDGMVWETGHFWRGLQWWLKGAEERREEKRRV